VVFLSSCALWNRCTPTWRVLSSVSEMCVRAERLVSCQGVFHVYFVREVDVFVVVSVEPVERSRVCVSCWYGEKINRVRCRKNYGDVPRNIMYKIGTYVILVVDRRSDRVSYRLVYTEMYKRVEQRTTKQTVATGKC